MYWYTKYLCILVQTKMMEAILTEQMKTSSRSTTASTSWKGKLFAYYFPWDKYSEVKSKGTRTFKDLWHISLLILSEIKEKINFYSSYNNQKTFVFLMISGWIEVKQFV